MTHRNQRMTNNRHGEEWYDCERCGEQFPRSQMIVQHGFIVCVVRCVDQPGRDSLSRGYPLRVEADPLPLPVMDEDE